ncbi:MAG: hypothetical protein OXU20_24745 [Myxococcales bacterium]|nr:hypothetical protein [Myxococcales bacterium]
MVRSRHLEVVTDGDPAQARQLVRDLERFHHVMMAMTTATERQETPPLRVFLTGSRRVFRKLGGKQDAAANFFSTSRGHYALVDQHGRGYRVALRTLLHEYVHHIVALGGGWPPSWYNEGLAEYMETTEFFDDGSYTLGKPLSYRPSRLTLTGWVPMRKVLEADRILDLQREDVDVYGQAWCFVHYALSTAERRDRLHRFLAARRAGRSVGAALEESFGIDASELDGILQVYVEKPAPSAWRAAGVSRQACPHCRSPPALLDRGPGRRRATPPNRLDRAPRRPCLRVRASCWGKSAVRQRPWAVTDASRCHVE